MEELIIVSRDRWKVSEWRVRADGNQQELLKHLWMEMINVHLRDAALDNVVNNCRRNPNGPFGDTGPAIERLLAAGVSRRDLSPTRRSSAPSTRSAIPGQMKMKPLAPFIRSF